MYRQEYKKLNGGTYQIYETTIQLPDKPPLKEMVNYGKPLKDQKYEPITKTFPEIARFNQLSKFQKNALADKVYHILWEGRWQIIKGEPFYCTGDLEGFCSFWHTENGIIPKWRLEAFEWFFTMESYRKR